MGRALRIEFPGALYHIMSRGNEKKDIFLENSDRAKFLKILEDYYDRYGILIHCYVLMNHHYHLLLETPLGNLLKVMHGINSSYTGYFNRKYNRVGHLFQGRYKGILIDKESYLMQLGKYIHLNPVRAHITAKPEEYPWSSYSGYIGKVKELKWIEYSWILSKFDRSKGTARKKYKEYVLSEIPETHKNPFINIYGQIALGNKEFIDSVIGRLKNRKLSDEIIERKKLKKYPSPDKIIAEIAKVFNVKKEIIMKRGSRNNTARKVSMYLIKRYCNLSIYKIGEKFGRIHFTAVTRASRKIEDEMASNKDLLRMVNKVKSKVKA